MPDLNAEDEKLLTLARATLARSPETREAAAVRDDTGRTYAATAVSLGPLSLSALELAAAMAASSGVTKLEMAVFVTDNERGPGARATAALAALGAPTVLVHLAESAT